MKIIILLLILTPVLLQAQNTYTFIYDDAGNRTERFIVVPRIPSIEDTVKYNDKILDHKITIFPNPTDGRMFVEITNLSKDATAGIELFDIQDKEACGLGIKKRG